MCTLLRLYGGIVFQGLSRSSTLNTLTIQEGCLKHIKQAAPVNKKIEALLTN